MMSNGYGMDGFSGVGMLFFVVLAIFGVVMLLRWFSDDAKRKDLPATLNNDPALEIARQRFAKNEISLEEFEIIKRGLG